MNIFKVTDLHCWHRYSVAESDCNLALALDKNYTKAYARRGAARFALKNLQGAKEGWWVFLDTFLKMQVSDLCAYWLKLPFWGFIFILSDFILAEFLTSIFKKWWKWNSDCSSISM